MDYQQRKRKQYEVEDVGFGSKKVSVYDEFGCFLYSVTCDAEEANIFCEELKCSGYMERWGLEDPMDDWDWLNAYYNGIDCEW